MLIYDQIYIILFVFYMLVSTEIKLLFYKDIFLIVKNKGGGGGCLKHYMINHQFYSKV